MSLQADGKIVIAGQAGSDFSVARYTSAGVLDTTFGGTGVVITSLTAGSDSAQSMTLQSDGKMLAAGTANADFAIVRYDTNGTLDTSFDTDAVARYTASGAPDRDHDQRDRRPALRVQDVVEPGPRQLHRTDRVRGQRAER